jgi:hypothetical protein
MKRTLTTWIAAATLGAGLLPATGCFRGGGDFLVAAAVSGLVAAAIISATAPPPPRYLVVPAPRDGYVWQRGYWRLDDGRWVWIEGQWVSAYPGYRWDPAHWEPLSDGTWRFVEGRWIADR